MSKLLIVFLKFTLAGAIVFGIGFLVLIQDKNIENVAEVKDAKADLVWLDDANEDRFSKAMYDMGLRPRTYDLNGNIMYFAHAKSPRKPKVLLNDIQDHLVSYGVNDKNYSSVNPLSTIAVNRPIASKEDLKALEKDAELGAVELVNGNVMPTKITDSYIAMSGIDWGVKGVDNVIKRMQNEDSEKMKREGGARTMIKGYKFIDATWESNANRSEITAVWTDSEFNAAKLENKSFLQTPPDPNVPSCIGCSRDFRIESLDKDEPYRGNQWSTNTPPQQTYEFYVNAMGKRGWKESKSQQFLFKAAKYAPDLARINGRIVNLEKNGKNMTIAIVPNGEGGSEIMSQERYKGADLILGKR